MIKKAKKVKYRYCRLCELRLYLDELRCPICHGKAKGTSDRAEILHCKKRKVFDWVPKYETKVRKTADFEL